MGREVENVEFKGSRRRRETRIYARASDAALPARPSRNIVILGIFVVPAKKKGPNEKGETSASAKPLLQRRRVRGSCRRRD